MFSDVFWYTKTHKQGFQGSTNPEIMKMLGFGSSHNKAVILLDQN